VRSPLELTYLRDVERAHGLNALVKRQLPSRDLKAVRDVWYVDFGVVVELDGRLGHSGLGRFRDLNRDNLASLDGLLTLRFGAGDLHGRPCEVAAQVARGLQQRGWTGLATRCRHCRAMPDSDWG
jgi:very-short-patch-repair endonuclease